MTIWYRRWGQAKIKFFDKYIAKIVEWYVYTRGFG